MKKVIISILLSILSSNIFASVSFPTGNDIYDTCNHLSDKPTGFSNTKDILYLAMMKGRDAGVCYSAVGTAFVAITGLGYQWSVDEKFSICMENYYGFDRFSGQQILDLTLKFLKNNPQHRSLSIVTIMSMMLHEEFPSSVCHASAAIDRESNLVKR